MATSASVIFGQLVIGAPGAGKTTYCEAMSRFLKGGLISKSFFGSNLQKWVPNHSVSSIKTRCSGELFGTHFWRL